MILPFTETTKLIRALLWRQTVVWIATRNGLLRPQLLFGDQALHELRTFLFVSLKARIEAHVARPAFNILEQVGYFSSPRNIQSTLFPNLSESG